mmetsp:Transcript_14613/g.16638  ORF Transcript_14613/g.16638 Transcript_14613/m.16638 type:complete len:312 (-) Transcript_14613:21-956(-)
MTQDENTVEAMQEYIDFASEPRGQLMLLIFISTILGLGKGGVPGLATVATALTVTTAPMNIKGGLGYAVSLQVPILAMIDVSAAWLHNESIDWNTIWLLLPLSFVGMGFGQVLDRYMTDSLARVTVGFILLSILILKVWGDVIGYLWNIFPNSRLLKRLSIGRKRKVSSHDIESHDEVHVNETTIPKSQKYGWACFVGFFGGAATMLTNSMGPILNVFLLSVCKLSPTEYIGTRAMFFCFLNVGKIPMRFITGSLGLSMLPLAFGLGFFSVMGVFGAKPIMLGMNERTFVILELIVVAFAGTRLMWLGLTM